MRYIHPLQQSIVMNKFIYALSLIVIMISTPAMAEIVDRIVAVVNEDVITMSELEDAGQVHFLNIKNKVPAEAQEEALQKARMEVRENLIDKYLVAQKAKKMNVKVGQQEVNDTYNNMVAKSGLSREQFLEKITLAGHSEFTYRDNLKNQILQSKIINYDVRSKIIITEKMMRDFFKEKYLQEDSPGGYYLLQMGFIWQDTSTDNGEKVKLYASKADAKAEAEKVHNLVTEGGSFKELAKRFSNLPSGPDGGDIGLFQEDELAPFMRKAITNIEVGNLTSIIETDTGFQFFKLQATAANDESSYETMKEEIRNELYEKKLTETFDAWVIQLKEGAYIKRL